MSWIETILPNDADDKLKGIYNKIKSPDGQVDNVLSIHSLRPHSMVGHMALYKSVLHHRDNSLPHWYLEALGVYVSHINNCRYCADHHFAGFSRLIGDRAKANTYRKAIMDNRLSDYFDGRYLAGSQYAYKLTVNHHHMVEEDVIYLRTSGFTDGEILEINQVVAYFNYVNRVVVGLGVVVNGEKLGLSPDDEDDATNWQHK